MFVKRVYLYCNGGDNCPLNGREAWGAENDVGTIKQYKEIVKEDGWVFRGHKTYCPDCAKKLKSKQDNHA